MQVFENIGTLRGEEPRAALRCSSYLSLLFPRQVSVCSEPWTQQSSVLRFSLAESTL